MWESRSEIQGMGMVLVGAQCAEMGCRRWSRFRLDCNMEPWITPCICYQACNRNAIIAIIWMHIILATIHHHILRGVEEIALASGKNLLDFSLHSEYQNIILWIHVLSHIKKKGTIKIWWLNCSKAPEIQPSRFDRSLTCSLVVLPMFWPRNYFEAVLNLATK